MKIISAGSLDHGRFEGASDGPASISMILDESGPGTGPRLRRHPYDETWVIEEETCSARSATNSARQGPVTSSSPHPAFRTSSPTGGQGGREWCASMPARRLSESSSSKRAARDLSPGPPALHDNHKDREDAMPADPLLEAPRYPDLAGKIAVVTGGSRGIGAATARALAANGAMVAVVGRDEDALAAVTDDIQARGGRALAARADCTIEAEISRAAHTITAQVGPVDILAAFAGGNGMPVPTATETAAHWHEVIESDLTATFLTTSQFMPAMIERHHGSIITMSSAAARQAAQSSAAYAAAKAGVIAFTRHLANEIAPRGVRVNCLAPSAIENDRIRTWTTAEQRQQLAASFPLRRIGQPDDVAAATLFLASNASAWITGITLDIAGGKVML